MNCGERIASATVISGSAPAMPGWLASTCGGRRISIAAGSISTATTIAMICIAVRQSYPSTRKAASGDIVIGATPKPTETRDTASERWVSDQPTMDDIIGAINAAIARPDTRPKLI